ncbi:MAG: ROK family protein [Flavobacteriales bacterium]
MILGIDIGGTTIKLGVVDEKGNILTASKFPTEPWTNPAEKLIELIEKECTKFQKEYSIEGVGIGVPGQISADKESILELTNIPSLNGFALRSEVQKVLPKLKVVIENDARCAAMGELQFGGHGFDSFVLMTLGTGVGGGVVINRKIFTGASGNAGEIGMIPVGKGKYLEEYVGQRQIVQYATDLLQDKLYLTSVLKQDPDLSVEKIYFAATDFNDSCAKAVFKYAGTLIGEALLSIIHLYDVHNIVIGGGVGNAFDLIKPAAETVLKHRLMNYYYKDLKIVKASNQSDTGIIGAASLAL